MWASPSEASDMMFDVRQPGVTGLGYALLRPRSKGQERSLSRLAFAKMNPIEPGPTSPHTRCGMPTTARDHRLLLAPGVADPVSLERLFADYDAAVPEHQRLLAAVLTLLGQLWQRQPLGADGHALVTMMHSYCPDVRGGAPPRATAPGPVPHGRPRWDLGVAHRTVRPVDRSCGWA